MNKRDATSVVFIGACVLTVVSAGFPCNQVNMEYSDHSGMRLESVLDLQTGIICILLPLLTAVFVILGKRILSSVFGIITVTCHALSIYHFIDAAQYASKVLSDPKSPWVQIANYSTGIEKITIVHPFGFYFAIAALAILLIISVINLFVKDEG